MSQAEVKPFKVGEPLASKVDGNPEPSSLENSKQACVETGRRVCIRCGNVITKPRNHDRRNNELHNLKILCKGYHQDHHCKRDKTGKYIKGQSTPA